MSLTNFCSRLPVTGPGIIRTRDFDHSSQPSTLLTSEPKGRPKVAPKIDKIYIASMFL